jgi:hypothetical protein
MNEHWSGPEMLAILDNAETVAWIFGDTETARRLEQLADEVRYYASGGPSSSDWEDSQVC